MEFAHAADLPRARDAIVEVCRLMHQRGYIAAADGNVSVRLGERRMLVTPTGARKGFLKPDDLAVCDLEGRPVRGEVNRPSSEIAMHVAVYANRSDVRAVVHAHPPCAVAHTVARTSLAEPLMPEVYCELGEILTLSYTTPTTVEVPDALQEPIRNHDALLLERHGSITVGPTLEKAYDRLEILEHAARISLMAHQLALGGAVRGLTKDQIDRLKAVCG